MIIRHHQRPEATTSDSIIEQSADSRISCRQSVANGSVSGTMIASYIGVFLLVVSMIAISYRAPVNSTAVASVNATGAATVTAASTAPATEATVDKVMAANIASSLAESTDMPVTNNVANLSQSLAVESVLAQTDTNVITKPQIVQPAADSRVAQQYTTVAGDSTTSVGQKFGISAQTIKWANKLASDALEPGKVLTIPAVDGVIYTVKAGDTIDSIASKYKSDPQLIKTFNDLDLAIDLVAGTQITIPGGDLPTEERPGYVAPRAVTTTVSYSTYIGGYGSGWDGGMSAGNRYGIGQCTWYAYERRMQLGNPVGGLWGNANTWAYSGRMAGFLVDGNPAPGAVMANGGGYGHVAIVESVNPGVSVTISEMNGYRFGGGWNRVGHGDISWGEAVSGMYQYIH